MLRDIDVSSIALRIKLPRREIYVGGNKIEIKGRGIFSKATAPANEASKRNISRICEKPPANLLK